LEIKQICDRVAVVQGQHRDDCFVPIPAISWLNRLPGKLSPVSGKQIRPRDGKDGRKAARLISLISSFAIVSPRVAATGCVWQDSLHLARG
jgi:hypothetical protein